MGNFDTTNFVVYAPAIKRLCPFKNILMCIYWLKGYSKIPLKVRVTSFIIPFENTTGSSWLQDFLKRKSVGVQFLQGPYVPVFVQMIHIQPQSTRKIIINKQKCLT